MARFSRPLFPLLPLTLIALVAAIVVPRCTRRSALDRSNDTPVIISEPEETPEPDVPSTHRPNTPP